MALLQMKCTALNIAAGTATLTPQANVIRENEFQGITSVTIAANANTLRPITWELNAFYDVEINKAFS
jgi:hypothetical protein